MCGIAGVAGVHAADAARDVAAMGRCISHRGPDATRHLLAADGRAIVSMNTLAVISDDELLGPYEDAATGCLITYNGEVYNYRELARRWGIPLTDVETDAHLVLRGYLLHGRACLEALDGMFAVAIYDPRSGELLLARDRFGEKPLYYVLDEHELVFASEVKALRARTPLTPQVPAEWLTLETPLGVETPYEEVRLLPPGVCGTLDVDSLEFAQVPFAEIRETTPLGPQAGYEEALAAFTALLREAAASRVPDRRFALMISGGLDSSVLAYLMQPDELFIVRYPGHEQLDEYENAERVAADLGIVLTCVEPSPADFVDRVESMVHHLDYPVGNASLFSEYMLYEAVAEAGYRVVVGGIGPDELLLGYVRHSLLLDGPAGIRAAGLAAYNPLVAKFERSSAGRRYAAERYYRLLRRGVDIDPVARQTVYERFRSVDDIGRALTLTDLATSFPPLVLTSDKLSSAFGLERRSPFLATALADACFAAPLGHKRAGAERTKLLLRDAARTIGVPAEICDDANKLGFASPVPKWLDGELREWCDAQLAPLASDDAAPTLLRYMAARALTTKTGPYDRHRLHALLLSVWWRAEAAERDESGNRRHTVVPA